MADRVSRRSALKRLFETKRDQPGLVETDPGVTLENVATFGAIDVRADQAGLDRAAAALGFASDAGALSETNAEARAWLWLGPDQRWAITAEDQVETDLATLEKAFGDGHKSLVDITDRLSAIEVSGPRAQEALSAICLLDLDKQAQGSVAGTHLHKVNYTLRVFAQGHFQLICNRSYADYLWRALEDACREFGYLALDKTSQK